MARRRGAAAAASSSSASVPVPWEEEDLELLLLPIKPLGRGSFGRVDLALHRASSSLFAVKRPTSPSFLPSLRHEFHILERLRSPRIIRCLGSSHSLLLLEFLPRGSLSDLLPLSPLRRFSHPLSRLFARSITQGLAYLHSLRIVHCDIKGRNVLVGDDLRCIKIADFGSAKLAGSSSIVGDTQLDDALCHQSGYRGSPLWMAPEVVLGIEQETASDIWSLGCTVIEMLQGYPPWLPALNAQSSNGADTNVSDNQLYHLLLKIARSDETPPFPADISEQASDFLSACLHRDPRQRWTAEQLLRHPFLQIDAELEGEIEAQFLRDFGPCPVFDPPLCCEGGNDVIDTIVVAPTTTTTDKLCGAIAAESPRGVLDLSTGVFSGSESECSSLIASGSAKLSTIVGANREDTATDDIESADDKEGMKEEIGQGWVTVRGSEGWAGEKNAREPFAMGIGSPEMRREGDVSLAFLEVLRRRCVAAAY